MDMQMTNNHSTEGNAEQEIRVCVIDDEEGIVKLVQKALEMKGFTTLGISNVIGSSNLVRKFRPHIVILDIGLPAIDGKNLLELFRKNLDFSPRIILFSGMAEEDLEELARQMDADDFQVKGEEIFRLIGKVNFQAYQLRKFGVA